MTGEQRSALCLEIAAVVTLSAELPDGVFVERLTNFYASDVLFALGAPYARVLNRLGGRFGDRACSLVARRPSAAEFEGWDTAGAIRFDLPMTEDVYWEALNAAPAGDITASLVNALESWVLAGDTGQWACWCDRAYELAIVGSAETVDLDSVGIPFQGVGEQLREMLRLGRGALPDAELEAISTIYCQ